MSSIPVWSVLAGPWAFGTFLVILQTVIAAGVLFSGGSSCSHGPLNNFSFSTVRIISLLDVISINSVVGQVACISLKVCVLLFFSSCLAFAALVLYLLIASRADFMSIGIRPLGVFCFVVHRWQNQSWGGNRSGLCSLGIHFLWKTRLHSAQALAPFGGSVLFCWGVSFLHMVQCVSGSGFWSRWMSALGFLWLGGSVTRSMRPVLSCPCACAGLSAIFWPCRCRCCVLSMGLKSVSFHVRGVITLSLGCTLCAIRQTSSQASRCLSRIG